MSVSRRMQGSIITVYFELEDDILNNCYTLNSDSPLCATTSLRCESGSGDEANICSLFKDFCRSCETLLRHTATE